MTVNGKYNRKRRALCAALGLALLLSGCAGAPARPAEDGRLRIVTTLFPYYDFARAIAGERAEVTLLLLPGREAHSFEPTPLDAVRLSRADVLIFNGGESEEWVDDLTEAAGENIGTVLRMTDYVETRPEELVEGMQGAEEHEEDEEDGGEAEFDEHIWTAPDNAAALCEVIGAALCAADPDNAAYYAANCAAYAGELRALDARFRALRTRAARDLLVFADRMPLLYLCKAYGLRYRAAFHGCSTDTEPSLGTLLFLIGLVRDEGIPVVYTVDLDSRKIAEAVSECTGAEIETLYSLQTVSRGDFNAGETYLTLMERNLRALERGLC